jgi:hypothetical protein
VDFSSVLVLIAAMNEEEGIGPTLSELKKTLDEPSLSVRANDLICDCQVLLHLNCLLEEGS